MNDVVNSHTFGRAQVRGYFWPLGSALLGTLTTVLTTTPLVVHSCCALESASLAVVHQRFRDMAMAGRGGLMILNGLSGAGKTLTEF